MKFMVIERFLDGRAEAVYERFAEKGRILEAELTFIDSWTDTDITMCFQLMESPSMDEVIKWTAQWSDLIDFEIIPVIDSREAALRLDKRTK